MKKRILPLLVASLFAIQSVPASTQENPSATETSPAEARFDLDFPGGTITDLIEQISQTIAHSAPVIVAEEGRNIRVPAIKLTSTTVDQVFDALMYVLASSRDYRMTIIKRNGIWAISHSPIAPDEVASTQVFQISPFLDSFQLEDVTTAIETAWQLSGIAEDATIRFHEETKLLFIHGTHDQISLVRQILQELSPKNPEAGTEETPEDPAEITRKKQQLTDELNRRKEVRQRLLQEAESNTP